MILLAFGALLLQAIGQTFKYIAIIAGHSEIYAEIEADAKGQVAVERALQLDDQLGEAQTSLANLLRQFAGGRG